MDTKKCYLIPNVEMNTCLCCIHLGVDVLMKEKRDQVHNEQRYSSSVELDSDDGVTAGGQDCRRVPRNTPSLTGFSQFCQTEKARVGQLMDSKSVAEAAPFIWYSSNIYFSR